MLEAGVEDVPDPDEPDDEPLDSVDPLDDSDLAPFDDPSPESLDSLRAEGRLEERLSVL